MGRPKQLLDLNGRPVVAACLETIIGAGIKDVVVVVGPGGSEIGRVAGAFPVTVVENEDPETDMAQSVRVGLGKVSREASGVLVCLCDHPLIMPETMAMLCAVHAGGGGGIIIPCYRGRKGHPTLFARALLEEMGTLLTLRDIIERHGDAVRLVDVEDEGTVLDMDTWEEYREMVKRSRRSKKAMPTRGNGGAGTG